MTFETVALGAVGTVTMGLSPSGDKVGPDPNLGPPLLNGPTEFGPVSPRPRQWTSEWSRIAEPGDTLFCVRGSTTGRINVAQTQYAIGRGIASIRGESPVDTAYIRYSLIEGVERLLRLTSGSVFPNISVKDLRSFEISWPTLVERGGIVATLRALDEKMDSNRRAIELLELFGAASLEAKLRLDVYGFPQYDELRLGDFLSVLETGSRPRGGVSGGIEGVASLGAENVQSAGVCTASLFKRVSEEFALSMRRGRLADEDILVYKDGGKPGNFIPHVSAFGQGFPVKVATINEHVYRVRAVNGISQALLYWILRTPWMDQDMRKRGTGVAIPGLNSTNFRDLPFPVLDEAALADLNDKLSPLLPAILRFGAQNQALAELRDTLLTELVSGRIRTPEGASDVQEQVG